MLFSSLFGVSILADRPRSPDLSFTDYLDHLLSYIGLTKSIRHLVITPFWPQLQQSSISPLTRVSTWNPEPPYETVPAECRKLLDILQESDLQQSSIEAYSTAIDRLFWLYTVADVPSASHDNIRWIVAWPIQVSDEYVVLLNQRRPEALIILAYYGVALHSYRRSWAVGDAGATLIKAVSAQVGKYWSSWLSWPMQIIRSVET
ncbi:MAG: hypothetical protein Q9174_004527 [Haloplaca sp. 1 TL-2023]